MTDPQSIDVTDLGLNNSTASQVEKHMTDHVGRWCIKCDHLWPCSTKLLADALEAALDSADDARMDAEGLTLELEAMTAAREAWKEVAEARNAMMAYYRCGKYPWASSLRRLDDALATLYRLPKGGE